MRTTSYTDEPYQDYYDHLRSMGRHLSQNTYAKLSKSQIWLNPITQRSKESRISKSESRKL